MGQVLKAGPGHSQRALKPVRGNSPASAASRSERAPRSRSGPRRPQVQMEFCIDCATAYNRSQSVTSD